MKIMQAIGGAGHGGAETFFVNLALAFSRAGMDQLLATRANPVRDTALQEGGLQPVNLKFGGALDWRTPRTLKQLAADYQPDIFLSWMSRAASMTPDGDFTKVARIGGYYKLKYFNKCDHLVGITRHLCDYIIDNGWPADRVHYIPNFVHWTPSPPVSRADLDTPEDAPLLLALGRLHPCKGLDVAIRALADIKDAYLWIGGEGAILPDLQALAADLGVESRVRFLGWRTDKEALLATADICVFPSRQEGFGNVILEAWASKTPIVAARATGPEAYIDHGRTGMLAPIDDHQTLAAHIRDLIHDKALYQSIVAAAEAEYLGSFNESAAVKRWQDFFETVKPSR
ncbi:glycosyltransferase [Sneathiella chinensis]|uniref:Glycosyl transferase n=1 Tax=Sneathiella chinensis TaxID=349750 RepID=A0ABQ5U4G7_9PROT|nr:glycosyltransferase [Sneathiella chinensis]GLQ06138.1 glycosyl transferase [Sneathiella chinensis]